VKRALDVRHRARHVEDHAVGMGGGHGQAVRLRKSGDRRVIFRRGAEARGELFRRQVVVEVRAAGVGDLPEQVGKPG
jgi:hypothetical protein